VKGQAIPCCRTPCHCPDWEFSSDSPSFINAIAGELGGVYEAVNGESSGDALDLCQRIQDTIAVLDFAMRRDDARSSSSVTRSSRSRARSRSFADA
jgi:hypothetical protein